MYRLLAVLVLGACTTLAAVAPSSAAQPDAELRIIAPADMAFRGVGVGNFTGSATFQLDAGTYTIVQAPPVATLQIDCDDGAGFVHKLTPGKVVTCTYR